LQQRNGHVLARYAVVSKKPLAAQYRNSAGKTVVVEGGTG